MTIKDYFLALSPLGGPESEPVMSSVDPNSRLGSELIEVNQMLMNLASIPLNSPDAADIVNTLEAMGYPLNSQEACIHFFSKDLVTLEAPISLDDIPFAT